jgi:hypothetical protein
MRGRKGDLVRGRKALEIFRVFRPRRGHILIAPDEIRGKQINR